MKCAPLCHLVFDNHPEIFDLLLRKGNNGDLDHKDITEKSLLHHAVVDRNVIVIKALLENGASANVRDNNGKLPVYFAFDNNDTAIVKRLIHVSDINASDAQRLLVRAMRLKSVELVTMLIHHASFKGSCMRAFMKIRACSGRIEKSGSAAAFSSGA